MRKLESPAQLNEKNSHSNEFHHLQHTQLGDHSQTSSASSFNLNFNRRTLHHTELRELSPYSISTELISHPSDLNLQTCSELSDQEAIRKELSQWSFPDDLPVSKREIIWGPYAESSTDENLCIPAQWQQTTPISICKQEPATYYPPTPTSLKRPRIQTDLINERDAKNSDPINRHPKRTRRKSSNETELGSELYSPTIVSPTYDRFNKVFTILEGLSPQSDTSSTYSNNCLECLHSQHGSNTSSNPFDSSASSTYPSYQPTSISNHHQTFSWYKPSINSNHSTCCITSEH
ncbi:uncharacterized protein MELLADRAFT_91351 [Melampsora larici-populina 98AG31]|uniref:Uncharacterized protein n=1 Tax=Melampsora larici-populina (strain 98AG31 / pathotype 3-4-7) TaxID=747676 RepID=F4RYR2_MELLP|nr:uncharacterized protein MELLADRAFT_91351 [Melampsora larici-populina 98AG31]EGG02532.1 hypothetical protein MELLADRAFT_91351 [Melampsora larici-populina 98AG31]